MLANGNHGDIYTADLYIYRTDENTRMHARTHTIITITLAVVHWTAGI